MSRYSSIQGPLCFSSSYNFNEWVPKACAECGLKYVSIDKIMEYNVIVTNYKVNKG